MMMMSSLKLVLIFGVGLVCMVALGSGPKYAKMPTCSQQKPTFHYFVLALQWPAAFCNIQRYKRPCNPDPPLLKFQRNFTIHGLWPQLDNGESLSYCSSMYTMRDSDLYQFRNDLLNYWPNLFSAGDFDSSKDFWRRQWEKHGSCSSNMFPPQRYLQITIDLARRYGESIYNGLRRRGIEPDGWTARRVEDTREVVKGITGYYPMLDIQLDDFGQHLLRQIHLCVEDDGIQLFDCDPVYIFARP